MRGKEGNKEGGGSRGEGQERVGVRKGWVEIVVARKERE